MTDTREVIARAVAPHMSGMTSVNPDNETVARNRDRALSVSERILAALDAAGLAIVPKDEVEWQTIESAPKDGTHVLSLHPYDWASSDHIPGYAVIKWYAHVADWIHTIPGNYMQRCEIPPTHWAPLPTPPGSEG